jgi:hypothetical protein
MADAAPIGVSKDYFDRSISNLHRELTSEIRSTKNEVVSEIRSTQNELIRHFNGEIARLEIEMREIGEMIVNSIDRQTVAVVGGVAASTVMLERTKHQIETDFEFTRNKLDLQIESGMQIEIGKKVAEASSFKTKLDAFSQNINEGFQKAIVTAVLNRDLYDINFKKILDEFDNKVKTIGDHIFQIRLEDIAPAEKASQIPYEVAHSLPIEMDLHRLEMRSQNLDQTLQMLKSSRLDDVIYARERVDEKIKSYEISNDSIITNDSYSIEGFFVFSDLHEELIVGAEAQACKDGDSISIKQGDASINSFSSTKALSKVKQVINDSTSRNISSQEVVELAKAANTLLKKGMVSEEAVSMFEDFLGAGQLLIVEKIHAS